MPETTTDDDTRLHWEASGAGEPVLLIQGLGWSGAMWFRLVPVLEPRFRVIRYDARGIGRSDVPPGPYSIPLMASDAAAVLDAAGVDCAHVFGCSLGGVVAQEFALSYPDRVASLILCCTHPAGAEAVWPDQRVMDMLTARTTLSQEEAIRAATPVAYAPGTPAERIEEDIKVRLDIPTSGEGYSNQLAAGLGYPGTFSRLHQISVPTLIVHGDGDQMVPVANADILQGAISDARTRIIVGAGHVLMTDHPEALSTAMLEFLEGVTANA